jgi:hypothetical protein
MLQRAHAAPVGAAFDQTRVFGKAGRFAMSPIVLMATASSARPSSEQRGWREASIWPSIHGARIRGARPGACGG